MTDQLYAKLRPGKARKDYALGISIAVAAVILGLLLILIGYMAWYMLHFDGFRLSLLQSTGYATEHDSLQAEVYGVSARVSDDHAEALYDLMTDAPGKLRFSSPSGDPDIRLEFGDGSSMLVWEVELEEGAQRERGPFWCYTDSKGKVWRYDSDTISYDILRVLMHPSTNEPWE